MSKSAIYTANTFEQNVLEDGIINLGTIIRRYGPNINLSGNAIQIGGVGYYDVDANFTVAPTAIGDFTITMYKNGDPVPGASATTYSGTSDTAANVSITSLVREFCNCCEGLSNLTFILSGSAATISNVAIVVEKL